MEFLNIRNLKSNYNTSLITGDQLLTIDGFIIRLTYEGCPNGNQLWRMSIYKKNGNNAIKWLSHLNVISYKINKDNTITLITNDPIKKIVEIINNIESNILNKCDTDTIKAISIDYDIY